MRQFCKAGLALLIVQSLAAPAARADRIVTRDGRVLSVKKARPEGEGYRLQLEAGEIVVPDKTLIASVEIEGDMSDYVPQNADEEQKLAQGYVKYRGKWMSKPAFEEQLRKEHEASRARLEEIAAHSDWSNAYVKESAHFVLRSNTSRELTDYYSELLETFYSLMDQRIGIDPTPSLKRTKMEVNVFKNRPEFRELSPFGGPMPAGVAGFFSPAGKSLNFYHDYEEPSISDWIGLHECTHLLTFLVDQQYVAQIWLNEAVADFFGSATIERDKKGKLTIVPGKLQTDRVLTVQQAIAAGKHALPSTDGQGVDGDDDGPGGRPDIALKDLFFLQRDQFHAFEYAHAWSFVYFLNTYQNGKYKKGFEKFFKGLYTLEKGLEYEVINEWFDGRGKRVPPDRIRDFLLKKIAVKDVEQLDREWKGYIASIPIEGPEARLKRGIMAVYRFDFEDALEDLDAAIAAGSKDPRAYWARGRARAFTGKRKDARSDLEKAVAADPLNARYRFEYSSILVGSRAMLENALGADFEAEIKVEGSDEGETAGAIKGKPEARMHAALACELDPENERYRTWFERFEE